MKDGGPAFPATLANSQRGVDVFQGMSLRDYFATHSPFTIKDVPVGEPSGYGWRTHDKHEQIRILARMNWQYADAMLAERSRGDKE